jgi:hypothetical protein
MVENGCSRTFPLEDLILYTRGRTKTFSFSTTGPNDSKVGDGQNVF